MEKREKEKVIRKKPNIILYTTLMAFVFIVITEGIIWGYGGTILIKAIENYPQGSLVIREAILAFMVLIVMLLFKNSYVFTQKREKITVGLFYGLFYLIGSGLFILLFGVIEGGFKSGLSLINITLGCLLVGICEEFLCRGWLLNEFLERYGDTKKGIWYSIIISGVIFGLMHLGNISTGQSVVGTITQVISACACGVVFGLIYYKTKNIWSVIILHALWDFSLFLGNVVPVTSSTAIVSGFSVVSLIFSLLMLVAELLCIIPHINDIDAVPKKKSIVIFSIVGFVSYAIFLLISLFITNDFGKEYKYDNLSLENYAVTIDNYDVYNMKYSNYSFKLTSNKNNLILTNLNTNSSVTIECESLYDYIIMEGKDYYILGYVDYTDSNNAFLKYEYINKNELSDSDDFLEKIKSNIKEYLLSERSKLVVLNNYENDKSYLSAYDVDYGYYVLLEENKMAILNRD